MTTKQSVHLACFSMPHKLIYPFWISRATGVWTGLLYHHTSDARPRKKLYLHTDNLLYVRRHICYHVRKMVKYVAVFYVTKPKTTSENQVATGFFPYWLLPMPNFIRDFTILYSSYNHFQFNVVYSFSYRSNFIHLFIYPFCHSIIHVHRRTPSFIHSFIP